MQQIIVPIFICVILPVAIVAIVYASSINTVNKRTKILIKAIESNCGIDVDKLAESFQKRSRSPQEILNLRLLRGCMFSFTGVALCAIGIILACTNGGYLQCIASQCWIMGGLLLAIGASYFTVYFVTRKQV